ncbi:MAG: phosphoribosylformylglycinamidine cyclo-ligase, partial [Pseudomonadota bacterium]
MGSDAYKAAGVDTAAAAALAERFKPLAQAAKRPGVIGGLGGFGGVFDPAAAGWTDPVLVAATDGVGTKLRIAIDVRSYAGIGQDLVAMCVNDLAAQGAEPLFFLDYFATGRLAPDVAEAVVASIARACVACGCALLGGETAEMPGMYADGDFDLAGFAVGAVERDRMLPRPDVAPGDVVLGFPSSGPHSNGYSLIRRIVADAALDWDAPAPFAPDQALGEALLEPTRLYSTVARALAKAGQVKAVAHVTGGGFPENLPRALPDGCAIALDLAAWGPPPAFGWLKSAGALTDADMFAAFNCG